MPREKIAPFFPRRLKLKTAGHHGPLVARRLQPFADFCVVTFGIVETLHFGGLSL